MEDGLEFNDLHSEKGISRFMTDEHQYAKGCSSASMIGYLQDMDPDTVFDAAPAEKPKKSVKHSTKKMRRRSGRRRQQQNKVAEVSRSVEPVQ